MKLLMTEGFTGAYDLDHRTTPEVVRISNVSNMLGAAPDVRTQKQRPFGGPKERKEKVPFAISREISRDLVISFGSVRRSYTAISLSCCWNT